MSCVSEDDFDNAVNSVVETLKGIDMLYPSQLKVLRHLVNQDNLFVTSPTNSGKTIAPVILPSILKELNKIGYEFTPSPKVLFLTALNSIQISLISSMASLGIRCAGVTSENITEVLNSEASVLFIGPEVIKTGNVTQMLLKFRSSFVCKVVDEAHLGWLLSKNIFNFFLAENS